MDRKCASITLILISTMLACAGIPHVLADSQRAGARGVPAASGKAGAAAPNDDLLEMHRVGNARAIRVRDDQVRSRLWVLTIEHVHVYSTKTRSLMRRIPLPSWSIADFICPPDMVLDRSGAALVSSNVEPRLLAIDPVTFEKTEHQLELISAKQWETGFGGLVFGVDGTLFGLSALAGSLFRIDLPNRRATEIALSEPVAGTCILATPGRDYSRAQPRGILLCAGVGSRSRRIVVGSDPDRAHVTTEPCEPAP